MYKYLVFLCCLVMLSACVETGGVYPPIPNPPGPTPPGPNPPGPTPPPVATTVEHGVYKVAGAEHLFYFSKTVIEYGKYTMRIGSFTFTHTGNYKKGNVEVRNAGSTGKMVLITDSTYKNRAASVEYVDSGGNTPEPPPPEPGVTTMKHHHYNTDGNMGFSLIDCPYAQKMAECRANGALMRYHGVDDCGGHCQPRHLYVLDRVWDFQGEVICTKKDGSKVKLIIDDTGIVYGNCD